MRSILVAFVLLTSSCATVPERPCESPDEDYRRALHSCLTDIIDPSKCIVCGRDEDGNVCCVGNIDGVLRYNCPGVRTTTPNKEGRI